MSAHKFEPCPFCDQPTSLNRHWHNTSLGPVGVNENCAEIQIAKKQVTLLKEILEILKELKNDRTT